MRSTYGKPVFMWSAVFSLGWNKLVFCSGGFDQVKWDN